MEKKDVSRETNLLEVKFAQNLLKWNKTHNLVRGMCRNENDLIENHFLDAFHLMDVIKDKNIKIIDVGSGNGIPGILMALYDYKIDLCEKDTKKQAFLKHQIAEFDMKDTFLHSDAYNIDHLYPVVVSRAFTSLNNLITIQKCVSRETNKAIGYYLKGRKWKEEIAEAELRHTFKYIWHNTSGDKGILEVHLGQ